ncbi:protein virilizer homolog [Triticum dicoccoides]|uniref:protein virilizer homolog n=1 Tax=Triticum dicoccoides TaxID=85692 RepID=UPI001890A7E9|nr:protein virilizer homolog [Triticum dicoccoides]
MANLVVKNIRAGVWAANEPPSPPFRSPPPLPSPPPRPDPSTKHRSSASPEDQAQPLHGALARSARRPRRLPGSPPRCAPSSGGGWSRSDPIQGIPHLLELDPAQVAAVKGAIDDGACPLDPLSDASDSDSDSDSSGGGDGDDEESDHPPKQGKAVSSSPGRQLRQGNDLLHRLLWKERNKHMFSSERRMAQDVIFAILKKGGCEEPLSTIDNVMCHNL